MPFLIHHISKDSKAWPFTPLGRLYPSLLEGVQNSKLLCRKMSRGSSPWLVGCMWPHMTMNATQHKIINLLKTLWDFFVITCHNVFNMWPKTTLLLPVWPRDAKSLDTLYYLLSLREPLLLMSQMEEDRLLGFLLGFWG